MDPVLHSFAYGVDFLCDQLSDVPEAVLAAQPAGVANHPAWTLGHVTRACELVGGVIGVPPWSPADEAARVESGSVPKVEASAYRSKADAVAAL